MSEKIEHVVVVKVQRAYVYKVMATDYAMARQIGNLHFKQGLVAPMIDRQDDEVQEVLAYRVEEY
jgi:hypothetical protein